MLTPAQRESRRKYRKKNIHIWRVAKWRKRGIKCNWEEYLLLLRTQEFKCAVCGDPINDKADLDHDHNTGGVRGILCRACNVGLGNFRDSPERLQRAIEYLQREKA